MIVIDMKYYKGLLNDLKFTELERLLAEKSFSEMEDILYQLAYDPTTEEVNLLVYAFLQTLLYKGESASIHFSISRLMGTILNHVYNAEMLGLFHGLRAAELEPENVDILEYLLYYNHIPERLLQDTHAIIFARKVISERPDSKAALLTLTKDRGRT
ncbi:hypothetical protein [Pedobacter glucosidilyticus]|uniref:hypothetical protein n=1 Tax=Pedobacter glucosidilyticus TaxID=1122941 RepID=UPI0004212976|nr:hypothetical protein [Pedobacter glucosidilyticus]